MPTTYTQESFTRPGESAGEAADPSATPSWVPSVPRKVTPPVRRSRTVVLKAVLPYLVVYLTVGLLMVRLGGTDSSQDNVSYAWEWFTIPVWVAASYLVSVPIALLSWAWTFVRRVLLRPSQGPPLPVVAPSPAPPTSLSVKSRLWPERRRWMASEGTLVVDDEGISFNPSGARGRGAVSVPWPSVTKLDLRPRVSWGRGQRGHLTIGVRSRGPVELMVPRPHYDRLAALLGTT